MMVVTDDHQYQCQNALPPDSAFFVCNISAELHPLWLYNHGRIRRRQQSHEESMIKLQVDNIGYHTNNFCTNCYGVMIMGLASFSSSSEVQIRANKRRSVGPIIIIVLVIFFRAAKKSSILWLLARPYPLPPPLSWILFMAPPHLPPPLLCIFPQLN